MIVIEGPSPCRCPTPRLPLGFGIGDRPEAVFVEARSPKAAASPDRYPDATDRIVVVGGAPRTLDLLRLATIRSDEVVLVAEPRHLVAEPRDLVADPHDTGPLDAPIRRFVDHFAIEYRPGPASAADFDGAAAILLAIGDVGRENALVRSARRQRIPVHVAGRPLLSDFTLLELVERHPASIALVDGNAGQRARTD